MPRPRFKEGFTLIEILIVLAFTSIIALGFPTFKAFNQRQSIQLAAKQFKTDLRDVQAKSVSGTKIEGVMAVWGVRLLDDGTTYTLFSCPAETSDLSAYVYDCVGVTSKEVSLKNSVALVNVADYVATGGLSVIFTPFEGNEVLFHDDAGLTVQAGGVDITEVSLILNIPSLDAIEERLVTISRLGNIEDIKL